MPEPSDPAKQVTPSGIKGYLPLVLILLCPPFAMCIWYTNAFLGGSFLALIDLFLDRGLMEALIEEIWGPYFWGSAQAWKYLGVFAGSQLLFMRILPGAKYYGPETVNGNIPVYRANGRPTLLITLIFFGVSGFGLDLFNPADIYREMGFILGALNQFALLFCLFLYFKGLFFPSSSDSGSSGNIIFDYYWGTELYPRILGWDIKQFTNSRFSMMAWLLLPYCYADWQYEEYGLLADSMIVSVSLITVYLGQFFWWESGYFNTMDIQHDRAGFYICWGVLVWVPSVYTSPFLYLAGHPNHLGWTWSLLLLGVGILAITSKNLSNRDRLRVRKTQGRTTVWGQKPVLIKAKFINEKGESKENLLLASGFWGISRHFHYVGEIIGAFCWSVTGLFGHFMPYFYVTFLSILLFHRAKRDDLKCSAKYGEYWEEYKKLVPYRVIPGLY